MKQLTILFILLNTLFGWAQTELSGSVKSRFGQPVIGANVYIDGSYDGTSTDDNGNFRFETEEEGVQTLVVSFVSFEPYYFAADVSQMKDLTIELKADVSSLDAVVISAGSFKAGDNSKVSVLKPLDVVTTASALGDFVGALQTLPGTTTVAEDGRLFVRGGDANETQIFIDGIRVFTPYTPTTNNIPTRGRYSPFLFDGITFSTGGYSAEYGQALSSVLLLNTIDEPIQEKTDISIMSVGLGLGNTQKWEKNSLSVNANYINLAPYIAIYPDRNEWDKPFEAFSGETVFRQKFDQGLLKFYTAFDATNFALTQEDIDIPEGVYFKLNNYNLYTNASYSGRLSKGWKLHGGGSYTYADNGFQFDNSQVDNVEHSAHFKLKLEKKFNNSVRMHMGAEQFFTDFDEGFKASTEGLDVNYGYTNNISGLFSEVDILFSRNLALKAGVRGEYSGLFDSFTIAPRVSVAYKTSKSSQISFAYGDYYQQPVSEVLKFEDDLTAEQTRHWILNYQYTANNRIFRAEVYRKDYDNLVRFDTEFPAFASDFNNGGEGYAQGLDLFWRDNRSIKNFDYWVSYSYLDSKRTYRDYPQESIPPFANPHNFSVVGKYFVADWKSQLGFSYQFGSGRTYTDPNQPGFLNATTKSFNSLSLNWAYLISQQKILYVSVNNALGFKNVNGYQYSRNPNPDGSFNRRALLPAADQFFFVGFFWTISEDGKENQLDNL